MKSVTKKTHDPKKETVITEKIYFNQSEKYDLMISENYKKLKKEGYPETFKPLFILACAAGLEYFLGFLFLQFCRKQYGNHEGPRFAYAYSKLRFKGQLLLIVPTLTNHEFIMNENNNDYKILNALILKRNSIIHGHNHVDEWERTIMNETSAEGIQEFKVKKKTFNKLRENHIDNIHKVECDNYMKAIEAFKNDVLFAQNKGSIVATDMVKIKAKFNHPIHTMSLESGNK